MRGEGLTRGWVVVLLVAFVLVRVGLHLSGDPYFDPDSYKYLSGADSLRAGKGLPPLYTDVAVNGGAMHVVPGYAYLIYFLWQALGRISIDGIAIAQSVISFLGYLALAHLVSRWVHRGAGLCVFLVLCLSPSIAWLEHSIMPDSIAAPVLMLSFWLAVNAGPAAEERKVRTGGAVLSGLLVGLSVLMRTSSQAYAPLPWLLAVQSRAGFLRAAAWTLLYLVATAAPLTPWALHNYEQHGVHAVAASTGRNLYFNAAWAGTLDREMELAKYGLGQKPEPRAAYSLVDAALQSQVAAGKSIPEADEKLREMALAAYKTKSWKTLVSQRLDIVLGLFVPEEDPGSASLTQFGTHREGYLANRNASIPVRRTLENRFRYRFSDDYAKAAAASPRPSPRAREFVTEWMRLAVEGTPLLLAWVFAVLIVFQKAPARRQLMIVLVAPPVASLVTLAFFGAPIYRYQAGLHPFMLAAVVVACGTLLGTAKRRLPRGLVLRRRLAA